MEDDTETRRAGVITIPPGNGRSGAPVERSITYCILPAENGAQEIHLDTRVSKKFQPGEERLVNIIVRLHSKLISNNIRTISARVSENDPLLILFDYGGNTSLYAALSKLLSGKPDLDAEEVVRLVGDAVTERYRINFQVNKTITSEDMAYLKEHELLRVIKTSYSNLPKGLTAENFRQILPEAIIKDTEQNIIAYKVMSRLRFHDEKFKKQFTEFISAKYADLAALFETADTDFMPENTLVYDGEKRQGFVKKNGKDAPYSTVVQSSHPVDELLVGLLANHECSKKEDRIPNIYLIANQTVAVDLVPRPGLLKDIFFVHHPAFCLSSDVKKEVLKQIKKNYCTQICTLKGIPYETLNREYRKAELLTMCTTGISKATEILTDLEEAIQQKRYCPRKKAEGLLADSQFYFGLVRQAYGELAEVFPEDKKQILAVKARIEKGYSKMRNSIVRLCEEEGPLGKDTIGMNITEFTYEFIRERMTSYAAAVMNIPQSIKGALHHVYSLTSNSFRQPCREPAPISRRFGPRAC